MPKNNNSLVTITTLAPSEWQQYKALRLDALLQDPGAFGRSFEEEMLYSDEKWQQRLHDAASGKTHAYFAGVGGRLVGMVGAKIVNQEAKQIAVIVQMYVAKSQRGKGIAKNLLKHLLHELRERKDIISIQLDVNTKQKIAINLYKSFGFTVIEERKTMMGDGKYHDEYLMELNTHSLTLQ